jgi:hypothetical protein
MRIKPFERVMHQTVGAAGRRGPSKPPNGRTLVFCSLFVHIWVDTGAPNRHLLRRASAGIDSVAAWARVSPGTH